VVRPLGRGVKERLNQQRMQQVSTGNVSDTRLTSERQCEDWQTAVALRDQGNNQRAAHS